MAKLRKSFAELERRLKKVARTKNVALADLFPPRFMSEHTRFKDVQEFFDASPTRCDTDEELENYLANPPEKWDAYIASVTDFESWEAMLKAGAAEDVARRLGLN